MSEPTNAIEWMVGDRACKIGDYTAEGTIVATFRTLAGRRRYVFEFDNPVGMLHIFSARNLELPTPVQPEDHR